MMQKGRNNLFLILMISLIGVVFFATSSVYAQCPNGITSLWALDEDAGNSFEDSVSGINGSGALTPAPAAGQVNGAQDFNGLDTGIIVPANASFNWAYDASFSIEYWMKRANVAFTSISEVMVGRDDGATSAMHWWSGLWDDGTAAFILLATDGTGFGTRATGELLEGNNDLTDGLWHHIVVVRDSTANENRLYVDGVLNDWTPMTYNMGAGFDSVAANLNLGWLNLDAGYHFSGTLDEVALYDRALLADEILQHFTNGVSVCNDPDDDDDDDNGGGGGGGGGCFIDTTKF